MPASDWSLAEGSQFHPDHKTPATNVRDERLARLEFAQSLDKVRAHRRRALDQTLIKQKFKAGQPDGTGSGIAPVGGTMKRRARTVAAAGLPNRISCEQSAQRHNAAAQSFTDQHAVGYYAVVIRGEQFSSTSQTALYLIEDQ